MMIRIHLHHLLNNHGENNKAWHQMTIMITLMTIRTIIMIKTSKLILSRQNNITYTSMIIMTRVVHHIHAMITMKRYCIIFLMLLLLLLLLSSSLLVWTITSTMWSKWLHYSCYYRHRCSNYCYVRLMCKEMPYIF